MKATIRNLEPCCQLLSLLPALTYDQLLEVLATVASKGRGIEAPVEGMWGEMAQSGTVDTALHRTDTYAEMTHIIQDRNVERMRNYSRIRSANGGEYPLSRALRSGSPAIGKSAHQGRLGR